MVSLTLLQQKIDSLIIEISTTSNNMNTKNYFDNIRLIEEDYN